jgi:hypothetical protein
MASKYDAYWGGQLHRIRAELQLAASGVPAVVSVPDLVRLGTRQSWYGVADVRGQEVIHSSKAHATSLGKQIAASGICKQWPRSTFRFTIRPVGDVLTITLAPEDHGRENLPANSASGQSELTRPQRSRQLIQPEPEHREVMTESTGDSPGRIFMSYRRDDTDYPAAWLFTELVRHFDRDQVFKDVDSIELGDDFVEVITRAVASCDVLLALIGRRWLTIAGRDGRRRLDNADDFVRLEIEAALTRNVRVIPILVEAAQMPRADELPTSLAKLARLQALELSSSRFGLDIQRLLKTLDRTLTESRERSLQQAAAQTAPVRMAAVGVRGQNLDVWALQADGTVRHWWWPREDGKRNWSAPEIFRALPDGAGPVADIAAGSRGPGHAEVFAVDRRGSLWHRWWGQDDGWADWQPLTSHVASPVAACSLKDGHLGIFVADRDRRNVRHSFSWAAAAWNPWPVLTGLSVPGPAPLVRLAAVGVRGEYLDAWALRTDGTISHAWWPRDAEGRAWSEREDFTAPGGTVDIATASRGPGHAEVFAIDQYGNLWHRWWLLAEGWAPWQKFTDHVAGPVAACSHADGHIRVFVTDPDSNVIKYSSSSVPGNWDPWRILG